MTTLSTLTFSQRNSQDNQVLATKLLTKFISREDRVGQAVQPVSIPIANKDEILKRLDQHLAGDLRLGLYNLLPDGTVRWAVVEFEGHGPGAVEKPLEVARQFQTVLKKLGVPSYLERSKSLEEENYHLWVFFETNIEAHRVNRALKALLTREGINPKCEVLPKAGGERPSNFGQFVWMPFFGASEDEFSGKKGGGIPSNRTVFLNGIDTPVCDPADFLNHLQTVTMVQFEALELAMLAFMPESRDPGAAIKGTTRQLQRILDNCPFIKWCIEHAAHLPEPLWWAMVSNLAYCEGGPEKIHEISGQDAIPGRYDSVETDAKIKRALAASGPITYETIVRLGWPGEPPRWPKSPAGWTSSVDPADDPVREENGIYVKYSRMDGKKVLSTFVIEPLELLRLPDGDALTCNVRTADGYLYEKVVLENSDWYTRSKFMDTLAHSDCTFHGSDLDVIDICRHVVRKVPVRKEGTRMIGLHGDVWVLRDHNINSKGYVEPMQLVPYDPSVESLHTKVQYQHLDDNAYRSLVQGFFGSILDVNLPQVIQPILGWFFAAPLKPKLQAIDGSFPLLMCYGTKGAGKTTVLEKLLAYQGYTNTTPESATTKSFPFLYLLSSTNAVPVFFDEYKDDMKAEEKANIKRYMRKAYRGEGESKGNPDKTITYYYIKAPMIVAGELKISEPAILERVIIGGFNDAITDNPSMQRAFAAVNALDAAGFMDRYIIFCLNADVPNRLQLAKEITRQCLGTITVNPRVHINLSVMVFGLQLMIDFAKQWGVDLLRRIDFPTLVTAQVQEITGNGNGRVKTASDILLEQMAMMIEKGVLTKGVSWTFAKPSNAAKKLLCIHLPSAALEVAAYKQRMHADFEVVDEAAYRKQFENAAYVNHTQVGVKFVTDIDGVKTERTKRAVLIDYEKALDSGLDIIGFRSDAQLQRLPSTDNSMGEDKSKLDLKP